MALGSESETPSATAASSRSDDVVARNRVSGIPLLLTELLVVVSCLASLESCAEARAVVVSANHIDQVRLGFGLNPEGQVSPGCTASTFSLRDPIHLSMQVTDAVAGSVVRVSVRDVLTKRIAWSEARPVNPGRSFQSFAIGRKLAVGRYRAESTLDGQATKPWPFLVHNKRRGVR